MDDFLKLMIFDKLSSDNSGFSFGGGSNDGCGCLINILIFLFITAFIFSC